MFKNISHAAVLTLGLAFPGAAFAQSNYGRVTNHPVLDCAEKEFRAVMQQIDPKIDFNKTCEQGGICVQKRVLRRRLEMQVVTPDELKIGFTVDDEIGAPRGKEGGKVITTRVTKPTGDKNNPAIVTSVYDTTNGAVNSGRAGRQLTDRSKGYWLPEVEPKRRQMEGYSRAADDAIQKCAISPAL